MWFIKFSILPIVFICSCSHEKEAGAPTSSNVQTAKSKGILNSGNRFMKRFDNLGKRKEGLTSGFDAVLGPRGPERDLVINSFFFLGNSRGLVGPEDFKKFQEHPSVAHAIPIALGDNFNRYPLVGTLPVLFEVAKRLSGKKHRLSEGRIFSVDRLEAVLGARVARELKMKAGDIFRPHHGTVFAKSATQHQSEFLVTGVLEESRTPFDIAIWVPLASVQNMDGHDKGSSEKMSAIYLKWKQPVNLFTVRQLVDGTNQRAENLTLVTPVTKVLATGIREMIGELSGIEFWVKQIESAEATTGEEVRIGAVNEND